MRVVLRRTLWIFVFPSERIRMKIVGNSKGKSSPYIIQKKIQDRKRFYSPVIRGKQKYKYIMELKQD